MLSTRLESVTITPSELRSDPARVAADLARMEDDPASDLMRRSQRDLMSLQGVASVHWGRDEPGQLTVNFANGSFQQLADNVLRDTVDGVRMVLTATDPTPPTAADWWVGSPSQMANSVRAMPGVVDSATNIEHGLYEYWMTAASTADVARLKALVNDSFDQWHVVWFAH